MSKNILFSVDSYKVSMWKQYPPGTEFVYSYIEARNDTEYYRYREDGLVFLGVHQFINDYLTTPITKEDVLLANEYWTAHGEPFNLEGWTYIVEEHGGILPLEIRAVPEGAIVPVKNALLTVVNTDPKVPWLTTWVETALLRAVWYPSTVATLSRQIKKVILSYLEKTGNPDLINFKLHDFGARGCSSGETAEIGGRAHLVNFLGTDTYEAVIATSKLYGDAIGTIGFSIPAAEHSTITSWGRENEKRAFQNMVTQFAKEGSIYATVSDSYDIYAACHMWGSMKDQLEASKGTLVIRPDSGKPEEVLSKMLDILDTYFGHVVNEKGFKVLNTVRLIWGDGINFMSVWNILHVLYEAGWSADIIAFGMGGALLQAAGRDDLGWAMKASAAMINGEWIDVFKDPVTGSGKASKKGRVRLWHDGDSYITGTKRITTWRDAMQTVYHDGLWLKKPTFAEIRKNALV